jgi:hypothetical protein
VVPPADQHSHFDVVLDGRRLQGVVDRRPEPHPRGVDRQREVVHHGYVDEFLGMSDHVDEGVYVVGAAGGVERRRRTRDERLESFVVQCQVHRSVHVDAGGQVGRPMVWNFGTLLAQCPIDLRTTTIFNMDDWTILHIKNM